MGKSISGTPLYELKVVNPNAIANFSEPKLAEAAAKDFIAFVGRQVQGFGLFFTVKAHFTASWA